MLEENVLNGVKVNLVNDTVHAIEEDPELAKFKFRLNNKWVSGGHNHSIVRDFYGAKQENHHLRRFELDADEPPVLVGEDHGPNPVEHLLNALAACMTTTIVYHAAIRGIHIEELESELEGDIDLRGFLGLSNKVRRGYQNIRVKFRVKTDEEHIKKLQGLATLSPVFDTVSHGTNVDVEIERM